VHLHLIIIVDLLFQCEMQVVGFGTRVLCNLDTNNNSDCKRVVDNEGLNLDPSGNS
jgi:hypothetical protein